MVYCKRSKTTPAQYNPFRYRGYYYDADLGLYYLNSRYYDSVVGRFINPDSVMAGVGGDLRGSNLYAYCFNNPVNMSDPDGNWPWLIVAIAVLVVAVVMLEANSSRIEDTEEFVKNCDVDPMDEDLYKEYQKKNADTLGLSREEKLSYIRQDIIYNDEKKRAENWTEAEMLREFEYHETCYNYVGWMSDPNVDGTISNRLKHVGFEEKQVAKTYIFRAIGNIIVWVDEAIK